MPIPPKPKKKSMKMPEFTPSRLIDQLFKELSDHGTTLATPAQLIELYLLLAGDQPWRFALRQEILYYLTCLERQTSIRAPDGFLQGCWLNLRAEERGEPPIVGSYGDEDELEEAE